MTSVNDIPVEKPMLNWLRKFFTFMDRITTPYHCANPDCRECNGTAGY